MIRLFFLPPYSSELNEVEYFLTWLKGKLKKGAYLFLCFNDYLQYCSNVI